MTQQDDITQRELTAEHHLNELMRLTQPWPNATIPCATVRSHVEQALSQVRAPVADERAADTLAERFALALTPVAYTTKRGAVYRGKSTRVGSENLCTISQAVYEFRAALASAPVAGERAALRQAVTLLLQVHPLLGPCDHELRDRIGAFLGKGGDA